MRLEKPIEEYTRAELVEIYEEETGESIVNLGEGYISVSTLREAVASLEDEESIFESTSGFEFVENDEAEEIDREAEAQWHRIPGSSARRIRK
jgi:hypothetical protein